MARPPARIAADDVLTAATLTSARPKDAATLLIVRRDGDAPAVLMGRRHRGHAFMPDKWVFPGGRIDRADFAVPVATELRADVAAALERTASPRRARALACAAIRETFEETGLMLGRAATATPRAGVWRPLLMQGRPDLGALDFIARAVTPPARTRRFDARFFMADAAALMSLDLGTGSGELDELAWFDWEAAAALDLPQITRAILGEAALRLTDPARPIPCHRFRHGKHRLETV